MAICDRAKVAKAKYDDDDENKHGVEGNGNFATESLLKAKF
jgi:hypothetical protein